MAHWVRRIAAPAALAVALSASPVAAQDAEFVPLDRDIRSVWDLELGAHAKELNSVDFGQYACGTNGGPPSLVVSGWIDYAQCRAEEETGLHEIYFRYDDDYEYWALAHNLPMRAVRYRATVESEFDVIVSALFDADGFMVGFRIVSDQRAETEMRQRSVVLRSHLMGRLDDAAPWECRDLEPAEGEKPFGNIFIKDRCEQIDTANGLRNVVEAHYYRREGQVGIDPRTNRQVTGQFWSETRLEQYLLAPIADREARLAALEGVDPLVPDIHLRARDCPGCDLQGANLKRADLRGANLAGANLAGANLHDAKLTGADLTGANLAGADLNKADLKRAVLIDADLSKALLYEAHLDAANATGATFFEAKMARVELIRATLDGADLTYVDMREGRLGGVSLIGADLSESWLHVTQLRQANLTDARLYHTSLYSAEMVKAIFVNADLSYADLRRADMREAIFTNANLTGAYMERALLREAVLDGANLTDADLPVGFTPPD